MAAHDGFTLHDLYAYNSKQNNQAWPYRPSDGGENDNHSWDQGGDPARQRQAARAGMAFMLLSAGVPMFNGGNEFLRTQCGNNNPYNLDSVANWLLWSRDSVETHHQTFTQRLIAFRKAHPALRPAHFYSGTDTNGNVMEQLRWCQPDGGQADASYLDNAGNHAVAWRIDGTDFGDPASAIYVAWNGWSGQVDFRLAWPGNGKRWYRVTGTAAWNYKAPMRWPCRAVRR